MRSGEVTCANTRTAAKRVAKGLRLGRSLERDGLVTRTVYAEVPPSVEYALTPLGNTLTEPLAALRDWAEAYIETMIAAQSEYDNSHN